VKYLASPSSNHKLTFVDRLLGKPLATSEEEGQKVGVAAGVAILGLDGLSSAGYGPEAALTLLIPLGALGLVYIGPIMLSILALLIILYFSYRQTIVAYPMGGGSYTVAKENLGVHAGLLAAAALMLDYILNVAVGISAGIGALVSAVPALHRHMLLLCLITLALITLVNLRGLRESGLAFGVPTYLFVGMLGIILIVGFYKVIEGGGSPVAVIPPPDPDALKKVGETVNLWLILRTFAAGCTAMTGVEAVSNGVSAFIDPAVKNAQRTLTAIVAILAVLLAGIAYLSHSYHIGATDPDSKKYESVISQLAHAVVGSGIIYWITMGSVLAVLALSANTSFAGFPRLCRLVALDDFLPHAFAARGRRLVYTLGVSVLTVVSGLLLIVFGGITDKLIPLFAMGAFLAFTLSQAGMVAHWRRVGGPKALPSLLINGLGCICTSVALVIILVAKFIDGAWMSALIILGLYLLLSNVKRHYNRVHKEIAFDKPIDVSLVEEPVVLVPMKSWNILAEQGIRFAMSISSDVRAIHIKGVDEEAAISDDQWKAFVGDPAEKAGLSAPRLVILESPYRWLLKPLLAEISRIEAESPTKQIAVIIPELVEAHWYEYFLHNHRATLMKGALLFSGMNRVVVVNSPWYLTPRGGDS
jgi:amino acid transporter